MATSRETPEIVVNVDVQETPQLDGNSADRKYRYSFKPHIAIVDKSRTRMVYQLTDSTKQSLLITGIYTNDGRYQLGAPTIAPDARSVSFGNVNTQRMLINVLLQVKDSATADVIHADPQVLNEPEVPD